MGNLLSSPLRSSSPAVSQADLSPLSPPSSSLSSSASPSQSVSFTPPSSESVSFLSLCASGDIDAVQRLLAASPSLALTAADENGYGCVHVCAASGRAELMQWLLDHVDGLTAQLCALPLDDPRHPHPLQLARLMQHTRSERLLVSVLSRHHLGALLSSSETAHLMVDVAQSLIVGCNRSVKRLLGHPPRHLLAVDGALSRLFPSASVFAREWRLSSGPRVLDVVCASGEHKSITVRYAAQSEGRILLTLSADAPLSTSAPNAAVSLPWTLDERSCELAVFLPTSSPMSPRVSDSSLSSSPSSERESLSVLGSTAFCRALLGHSASSLHALSLASLLEDDGASLLNMLAQFSLSFNGKSEISAHIRCADEQLLPVIISVESVKDGIALLSLHLTPKIASAQLLLHVASGNMIGVETAIAASSPPLNVNERDYEGQTPLHRAVLSRHYELVKALLQNGSNARLTDWNGCTPRDLLHNPPKVPNPGPGLAPSENPADVAELEAMLLSAEERSVDESSQLALPTLSTALSTLRVEATALSYGAELARGQYGVIFRGELISRRVAIKHVRRIQGAAALLEEAEILAAVLSSPPHPNVLQIIGVVAADIHVAIVTELCSGGSLDALLHSADGWSVLSTPRLIVRILRDVARGLEHVHSLRYLHRDIAARNILLTESLEAKVADFGLAQHVDKVNFDGKVDDSGRARLGAVRWLAPEALSRGAFSFASDVWSFGVLIFECCARRDPFTSYSIDSLIKDIGTRGRHEALPNAPHTHPGLRQIALDCWRLAPNSRPTMHELGLKLSELADDKLDNTLDEPLKPPIDFSDYSDSDSD